MENVITMKKMLIAASSAFLICCNSDAMDADVNNLQSKSATTNLAESTVNYPIASLKPMHPFVNRIEMVEFYKTWDQTLTLEENQKKLLNDVLETCFDLSFKVKESTVDSVLRGETNSNEQITIFNKKKLPSHIDESILFTSTTTHSECQQLYNCDGKIASMIMNSLKMIVQEPLGCKLFRVMLAKRKANSLSKLVFIPRDKDKNTFLFSSSDYIASFTKR